MWGLGDFVPSLKNMYKLVISASIISSTLHNFNIHLFTLFIISLKCFSKFYMFLLLCYLLFVLRNLIFNIF